MAEFRVPQEQSQDSPREGIPLARPRLGEREQQLVAQVISSGMLSLGPMLSRFENDFAKMLGVDQAVATSSGTSALHLAVRGEGWGRGDRVVTTPLSFIASANCLLYEDVEPVFADIDPRTLCIDPDATEAAIDQRTSGLLPVHIFGQPVDLDRLEAIADREGLGLIEDCAQAIGTVCADGRPAGGRGNAAAFAFYANKQITTGEGGVLVPPDLDRDQLARSERNQGRAPGMAVMDHERLGFNYRMTDVQAAIGIAQLERLESILRRRRRLAGLYTERFRELGGIEPKTGAEEELLLPVADRGESRRSWFVYLLRLPTDVDRDAVIAALASEGIDARPYLPCIHTSRFYRERFGYRGGEFPVAEEFSRRALALPFFFDLTDAEVERVVGAVARALGRTPPG